MPAEHADRDIQAIRDMLSAMHKATMHVIGLSKDTAYAAPHPRDAALYQILVVGEAAKRVSEQTQNAHPEVAWSDIVGMRSILIHGYEKVDWDIVWDAIHVDFKNLEPILKRILVELEESQPD